MALDPTTNIGKLRLRVADYSDLPYLPDTVYTAVLVENGDNLPRSAVQLAHYILGIMSHKTHRKMGLQLEVWGAEAYSNYRDFLMLTISNPAFMNISPLPYVSSAEFSPMIQFQSDWNRAYSEGTQSQALASDAAISPNDGALYGPTGGSSDGWQIT